MTKKDKARYSQLIHELSRMSHDGWRHVTPEEYMPLERELREIIERNERVR